MMLTYVFNSNNRLTLSCSGGHLPSLMHPPAIGAVGPASALPSHLSSTMGGRAVCTLPYSLFLCAARYRIALARRLI